MPLCKLDGKSKCCCILSLGLFHFFPFTLVAGTNANFRHVHTRMLSTSDQSLPFRLRTEMSVLSRECETDESARMQCDGLRYYWGNIKINMLVLWLTSQVRIFFARLVYIQIGKMKAWDGKTGWSHGHTIQCSVCLVFQHDCVDLAHYCAGVTNHWLTRFSCFQSARCKTSNSGFESSHNRLRPGSLYYAGEILKPSFISTVRPCLVPGPQYFDSVIRFGSRGPGRKVGPRQKS